MEEKDYTECIFCKTNYGFLVNNMYCDCKYSYHMVCMNEWFKRKSRCILCNKEILDVSGAIMAVPPPPLPLSPSRPLPVPPFTISESKIQPSSVLTQLENQVVSNHNHNHNHNTIRIIYHNPVEAQEMADSRRRGMEEHKCVRGIDCCLERTLVCIGIIMLIIFIGILFLLV